MTRPKDADDAIYTIILHKLSLCRTKILRIVIFSALSYKIFEAFWEIVHKKKKTENRGIFRYIKEIRIG